MQRGRLKLKFVGLVGLVLLSHSVAAQSGAMSSVTPSLHVLVAIATPEGTSAYDTELYRVDTQRGDLTLLYNLGTPGVDFVRPDFQARRLIVATPGFTPTRLHVINMDDVAGVVTIPLDFSSLPPSAWEPLTGALAQRQDVREWAGVAINRRVLIDRPGLGGHWLALYLFSSRGRMTVALPLGSEGRREVLTPNEIAHVRVQGDFGVLRDYLGDSDAQVVDVQEKRVVVAGQDIGVPAPDGAPNQKYAWWLKGFDGRTAVMCCKDSSAAGDGVSRLYVRNSESGEWKTFRVPGSTPRIKMIDSWIIGIAASVEPGAGQPKVSGAPWRGRESPGASSRRQPKKAPDAAFRGEPEPRPVTDLAFRQSGAYYPGILFLIDSKTGRYYQIRTDQGDSEILLVYKDSVYYRVNDSLFVAPIEGSSIGRAKLLVKSVVIPEVHWAFMGS